MGSQEAPGGSGEAPGRLQEAPGGGPGAVLMPNIPRRLRGGRMPKACAGFWPPKEVLEVLEVLVVY